MSHYHKMYLKFTLTQTVDKVFQVFRAVNRTQSTLTCLKWKNKLQNCYLGYQFACSYTNYYTMIHINASHCSKHGS
jgi:hypothetical protein